MSTYHFEKDLDLKLIILFIAKNFKRSVRISEVTDIATLMGIGDYFLMGQLMAELIDSSLMTGASKSDYFMVTDKGQSALDLFEADIPKSVKDDILSHIKKILSKEMGEKSIVASYKKASTGGYDAFFEVLDSGFSVMSLSVNFADEPSAKRAVANFRKKSDEIYKSMIDNLLT